MSYDVWSAFAAASLVVLLIPGPVILLVVSYALSQGRRAAAWMVLGVAMGDLVSMMASILGLGALLLSSAFLFTVLRWLGAIYLIYLGWKLWCAPPQIGEQAALSKASGPAMAFHAFAVTATNPKTIVFFIAFIPQFLDPAAAFAPQVFVMVATFQVMAAGFVVFYVFLASRMRRRLNSPNIMRYVNRTGGAALMGMGVFAALGRRV